MSNYLQIEIETVNFEAADILVADLSEIGFYAFQQEENKLLAYIKEKDFDEEKLKEALADNQNYSKTIIEDKNWNQQWETDFQPVIVKDFAAIRADFHKPVKNVRHDIIITPKMSFGTGHHATTFLMVELMETVSFEEKSVLDFGTGTGVLAILAEKLGAQKVMAIDNDEWSINNTRENINANGCKNIFVEKRENLEGMTGVDIVLANINLNVLSQFSSSIKKLLQPGSLLLVSGFLVKDDDRIQTIFDKNIFVKVAALQRDGWLAVLFRRLVN
jgi:ribosomal protein L11 methyltransferase